MHHPDRPTRPSSPRRTWPQAFNLRVLKYGSHASVFTLIVLAVLLVLYNIVLQHNQRFDITQAKRFTLAEQSAKLLQGLQQPIKVSGFYSVSERDREPFLDLIKQYAQHNDKLIYEVIDPDRQPAIARQYDIKEYNTVVVEGYGKKEKIFRIDEATLTNAILKLTRSTKKVVYFLTGHGEPALNDAERNGYSTTRQALEEQNYSVQELVLARQPQVPDDAAVVILAGPRRDLLEAELEALSAFLGRGGHLLLLLDPEMAPGLVSFVKRYGLDVGNDIVIEPLSRLVGADYLMPVVVAYERHAITKDLVNIMTMFPVVRSVQPAKDLPPHITAQTLVQTSVESWAETDLTTLKQNKVAFDAESDRKGPISIAAVATITPDKASATPPAESAPPASEPGAAPTPRGARLVVLGDSEFANNSLFQVQGNGNLFLNTVSWLADEEDLIAIRPRKGGGSGPVMLTASQEPFIFWLPVVVLPFSVFASGAVVFMRRKWQQ